MQANWDDFRIALQVAESGTLTKAGRMLNMNHTTVLRHINQLEESLNLKLFIRHQRGYQLTDAGRLMLNSVPSIRQDFDKLVHDLTSVEQGEHGKLRITTLSGHSPLLNNAIESFYREFPNTKIQIIATEKTIPVESGITHISIRIGAQPKEPDIIVKKLMHLNVGYYASEDYIARYNLPKSISDYNQHYWAFPSGLKQSVPFIKQVAMHVKEERIIYQSNLFSDLHSVINKGMAIGPMAEYEAKKYQGLKRLPIELDQDGEVLWFVYHKDLKTNIHIQAFYRHLINSLS
ncbi:hypothetical protein TW85_17105 [Marinomonas sp. S3726]|uniref:LysR family transcriptional regulator n=1 Tax=Marinomonas sp. S3726 TaxID=579484 RepID=UPI0005F9AAA2|nr:LysR family transcriptional regulator [Marinomonas sp. S3726]KJZ11538.1 hypothetical protein TW85_17105 [Marinomonas sp. S3726]